LITKLQRLQNSFTHVVLQQPRRIPLSSSFIGHFTGCPSNIGVTYKVAFLAFYVRLTETPAYLNSLISNRVTTSRMSLRSSTRSLMAVPMTNTVCTSRSFSMCALVVWNSLLSDIQLCGCLKTLKSKLKTFLFRQAFDI